MSKNKSEQLGIPHGTAEARLRRQIMFRLLQELERTDCHVCKKPMAANDYSIEHIKPWLNRDPKLFWDLENISFSHRRCNLPHSYPGGGHGARPKFICGTRGGYRNSCRCDLCREWKRNDNLKWYKAKERPLDKLA